MRIVQDIIILYVPSVMAGKEAKYERSLKTVTGFFLTPGL